MAQAANTGLRKQPLYIGPFFTWNIDGAAFALIQVLDVAYGFLNLHGKILLFALQLTEGRPSKYDASRLEVLNVHTFTFPGGRVSGNRMILCFL